MAESDASLIFDVDYQESYKNIAKKINRIVNSIEDKGVTKLKFSIDQNSVKDIKDTLSKLSPNLAFDGNGLQQNINFKPIQPEITPVKIPTNFVGTSGQSIESLVSQMQNQIGKIAQSPVKVKVQGNTDEKGNFKATKAFLEYINKDLGVTEQRVYAIDDAGKALKATLQSINVVSKDKSNVVNTDEIETYMHNAELKVKTYENTVRKFANLSTESGQNAYNDILSTVNNMQTELDNYNKDSATMEEKAAAYEKLIDLSKKYKLELEGLNTQLRNENANSASNTKMSNLQNQISSIWDKHGATIKTNEEAYKAFQEVQSKINIGLGKSGGYANVKVAGEEVAKLKKLLIETGVMTDDLSTKMRKLFDVHLKTAITMMGIHALQQGFSQLVDNVKEIDSALTQLKIVSGESEIAIEKFADKAFKAAEKIGSSATDIMSSTETWSRLGYSLNDSLSLAITTAQFSNVGNISVEDATTSMTAILKAYSKDKQNAPEDAQKIADILTNVGEKYAISASELGEALKAGGASLEAANTNLEQSVALMAAGNAAVQDSSKVGNALKTTSMRIRGATAELSDAGEEVDDFCESTSKMQETIKGLSGVDIMEKDGKTFRSIYDIMVDISNVFDKLSDVNQASLLEALAGKRNATVVKSIITNIKDLQGAYEDAQNASGTVGKANAEYMDSIEGKLKTFTAKFQEFSSAVTNTDIFKGLIDGGTGFVDILQQILTFGDGIVAKIGLIVGVTGLGSATKLGRFMPSLPEDKNNGTVIKLVNCWEVCEYYNYKVA